MYIFKDSKRRANHLAPYTAPDGTRHSRIPLELLEIVEEPPAPADYDPKLYIRTEMDVAPYVHYERRSEDQILAAELAAAKLARHEAVGKIVVTTQAGNSFDGDEESQNRMSRSVNALNDDDTIPWVLANNSIAIVGKAELREALRLAGAAQAQLWTQPYAALSS